MEGHNIEWCTIHFFSLRQHYSVDNTMTMMMTTAAISIFDKWRDFLFTLPIRKFGLVDEIGKEIWKSFESKNMDEKEAYEEPLGLGLVEERLQACCKPRTLTKLQILWSVFICVVMTVENPFDGC